jgi:hypothetical protein
MDVIIHFYSWVSDEETEHSKKRKKHKRTASMLEDHELKHQA